MGIHLVAVAAVRGFLQVFHLSAPLLWPLNLWLPLARHLPDACVVLSRALLSQVAWLRRVYARGAAWGDGGGGGGLDGSLLRQALLSISY